MPLWLPFYLAVQSQALPVSRFPSSPSDTALIVIVATTDVHGRVRGWDYVRDVEEPGGLARAATIMESLRARHPDRVVLVDAGDLLQGNPFAHFFATQDRRRPHPMVEALNALGYDAATPGNHEFNYGLEFLARATGDATFSYVSANITHGADGDSLMFAPFVVIPRGGVRVGVTGFTTPGVMVWDRALVRGRARVRPIAEAAPTALRQLARSGVDLKVVVIHSGLDGPSSYDTTGTGGGAENVAASLAALDPKPDVVIVGHTHREMRDSVINGVHFVQPRNWARSLSVVHVTLVRGTGDQGRGTGSYRVANVRAELIPLLTVPESPRFVRRFADAHERTRAWAGMPLGVAGAGFDGALGRAQDTPLLDFINEVQRRRSGADLSATALFDAGAGFAPGEIRLRDVAGVYPYENTLRAVRISGLQLKAFLEHSARYYRGYTPGVAGPVVNDSVPGYNFDVASGIRYTIDLTQPVGRRIRMTWQGRAIQATDSFTLALNSYRQEGGGGYAMLKGAPVVYDRGENVRDLLVEAIGRASELRAGDYFEANWSIVPAEARAAALAPAAQGGNSTLLRVLATSDFHGQLEPRVWDWSGGRAVGGAAALKTWLDSLARACGCASVRLDAGDQMQGTAISGLRYGRPAIEVLNALGLDAAAIGNHEFDWSVDTLKARIAAARYRFLAANITDTTGTARPAWAEPWMVFERGGEKVGVIGLARPGTATSTTPWNVRGLRFGDMAAATRRAIPQVRAAGATVVIVLAHEGAVCDSAACRGEIVDFARQLDSGAVDLIVAGHTHRAVRTTVNGIPIVQAGSSGGGIAVVDFVRTGRRREARMQVVTPYADAVRPDPAVEAIVTRHRRAVDSITSRPVARLRYALPREGDEYGLGRLVADAFRNLAKTDIALINNSGIRDGLPGGTVTYGQLFQVLPLQNRVWRVTISGTVLLEALERSVERAGGGPSAHVSGLELWYDPRRPVGRRITRTRLADGRSVDRGRRYTLAVPDFLAAGGSGYAMLVGQPAQDAGLTDIDAVIRYLAVLRDPVTAPTEPRIHAGDR